MLPGEAQQQMMSSKLQEKKMNGGSKNTSTATKVKTANKSGSTAAKPFKKRQIAPTNDAFSRSSSSTANAKKPKISVSATTNNSSTLTSNRQHKRSSPFRIKVGCVVALRISETLPSLTVCCTNSDAANSNNVDATTTNERMLDFSNYVTVLTEPIPYRDVGLNIVGKRVRCFLPSTMTSNTKRRVLKGEVVRLLDHDDDKSSDTTNDDKRKDRSNAPPRPFNVELQIDRNMLQHFPALERIDSDVDVSKLSESKRRTYLLEQKIRGGSNKVTVSIQLRNPGSVIVPAENAGLRWVIQKLVPLKLFHKSRHSSSSKAAKNAADNNAKEEDAGSDTNNKASNVSPRNGNSGVATDRTNDKKDGKGYGDDTKLTKKRKKSSAATGGSNEAVVTRHVGDGNDSANQQIANWRWLASRYHDIVLQSLNENSLDGVASTEETLLSGGLVGEVVKVESSASSPSSSNTTSLAMVTLRHMYLPEHTVFGRSSQHRRNEMFVNGNAARNKGQQLLIRLPVEQLVIIGRKLRRFTDKDEEVQADADELVASHSYSLRNNLYLPLQDVSLGKNSSTENSETTISGVHYCHRCRITRVYGGLTACASRDCPLLPPGSIEPARWCASCLAELAHDGEEDDDDNAVRKVTSKLPCCLRNCDCRSCIAFAGSDLQEELFTALSAAAEDFSGSDKCTVGNLFTQSAATVRSLAPVDFGLPHDFVDLNSLPIPQAKPSARIKARTAKKARRTGSGRPGRLLANRDTERRKANLSTPRNKLDSARTQSCSDTGPAIPQEDYTIFKPTCARELVYDTGRKRGLPSISDASYSTTERPRNLREVQDRSTRLITEQKDDKEKASSSSRAARANQRRLMKDVASLGAANLGLVDTLASREPQLRFDRSGIHAWGVFADEEISAGEMIVEYRGELIGNAVAERREVEYEAAKIGSDYMFRIDSLNVCDATKQGNVARFINASCDPNCYTKIITIDGSKRIVIYAKKDINIGDELCYDYKFPLEYDESKRIPCHCGARDCRGFMNWDKRFVAVPDTPDKTTTYHSPLKCIQED